MNFKRFISSIILSLSFSTSFACGPFDALTSNPFVFHFYQEGDVPTIMQLQRNENVSLWQSLTSDTVKLSDIDTAVYEMNLSQLQSIFNGAETQNGFLSWLVSNDSKAIIDFLLLAKELEELRVNRVSQWYYPSDKKEKYDSRTEAERFMSVLERCREHSSGFLSDRYGLQYVRALIALKKYDECIDFYNRSMSKLPDTNLFKRMAKGYVAGCLQQNGEVDRANKIFAEIGDFNSISNSKKDYFKTLVRNNPESDVIKSRLNHWIGYGDRNDNLPFLEVADAALSSPNVINRGDWLYLKAYVEEIYNRNHKKALVLVKKALNSEFSKAEMRYDAELMELCLQAEEGNLCKDLRYYLDNFQNNSDPFFFYIVPALLKKGRKSEALLLANYAPHIEGSHKSSYNYSFINGYQKYYQVPDNTYANTGFQLMLSMSAQEIVNYKTFLDSETPIVLELRDYARHDNDYLNEIIGTLYMREGNYDKAVEYLSQVSLDYQKELNVYQCGYLNDNPWVNCYLPTDKWEYPATHGIDDTSITTTFCPENSSLLLSPNNAKLNFAREMATLQHIIKVGTPDERGLARIRYALARYNSFFDCWALTQYWLGDANQCNYKPFYWQWDGTYMELDYLKNLTGNIPNEKWLESEISKGLREIKSPEIAAEAEFLTGNYQKIAKQYPASSVGKYLSTHCDNWSEWI